MKIREIIGELEAIAPLSYAMEWDSCGLLVGDEEREVGTVLVALDATDDVIGHAIDCGAGLILTHHPMIFSPVGRVVRSDRIGRRILDLAEHRIACFAMHTNFDVAKMADLNSEDFGLTDTRVLSVTTTNEQDLPEGLGRIGELPEKMTLSEFARTVRDVCRLSSVRVYGDADDTVKTVAFCSGSGKSMIGDALAMGADVFVTGDLDYHTAIDAVSDGLYLIDAGHYGTEFGFISYMQKELTKRFPDLTVIAETIQSPYKEI